MNDAFRVGNVQGICDLNRDMQDFRTMKKLACDLFAERLALDILHRNEWYVAPDP